MKNPELFINAINTMLFSGGGDCSSESIWALGDFIEFLNKEYNLKLEKPNEDDYYGNGTFHDKLEKIFTELRNINK